ncbi:uncharacterized protein ACA1_075000 [Acanthamoeba castellanii str. Neff]|uniref:Uncharacterized protein n=1 Tax=Acanthamoeba castellanii (strain ATCC 30010 / Neff) TaxID=1257118 RepID=L8HFA4_ACACF|nr:uncharacterized protein ACA1_075000 [Acanthamoeba castellanii str. Neff]ELR23932.1 hypothetical protein ACA1_075000 [Acanthamoeba castellanii str. Neff]
MSIHKLDKTHATVNLEEAATRTGTIRSVPYHETIAYQRFYANVFTKATVFGKRLIPLTKNYAPTAFRWGLAAAYVIEPSFLTKYFTKSESK